MHLRKDDLSFNHAIYKFFLSVFERKTVQNEFRLNFAHFIFSYMSHLKLVALRSGIISLLLLLLCIRNYTFPEPVASRVAEVLGEHHRLMERPKSHLDRYYSALTFITSITVCRVLTQSIDFAFVWTSRKAYWRCY